jgi:BASS family bile acid:Na+ symporter
MALLRYLLLPLAWLGRQRGRAVAAAMVVAIALPPVGEALKPFVTPAVFCLLTLSFLRADIAAARPNLARPGLVLASTGWTMLAVPTLFGAAIWASGLQSHAPDLVTALMLQAVTSPVMAAPAFAALMGLDGTLALATLILGSALVSLTAPAFAALFAFGVELSPVTLGLKLGILLGGSAAIASLVRLLAGAEAIRRRRDEIDGANVVTLYLFAAALMSDFAQRTIATPWTVIGLIVLAFAISFGLLLLTALVFRGAGREQAFAIGVVASQRNLGLMLAAAGGSVSQLVWLYMAAGQFPIYLWPLMLEPIVRRLNGKPAQAANAIVSADR